MNRQPDSVQSSVFMIDSVGAQRGMHYYNFPYVAALGRVGLNVHLISTPETARHSLRSSEIQTIPAFKGVYSVMPKPVRGVNYLISLARIAYWAGRYHPSIVHFHFFQIPSVDDILVAWLLQRRIDAIATLHDIVPFASGADVTVRRGSSLHRIYRRLSGIIVNSEFAFATLAELDPQLANRAVVMAPGNYTAYAQTTVVPKTEARAILDLPPSDPLVLVFGTIKPNKRLDLALHALQRVLRVHPNTRLVIAGKPREADVMVFVELAQRLGIADRVIWRLQFISDAHTPLYYCAADMVLFPYQWIYQSAALVMAMSFGRPVVATAVGSNPEFIRHEENGLLVPPDSSDAMAQAITQLLDQPRHATELGEAAVRYATAELSWDRLAHTTKDYYEQVLTLSGGAT